MYFGRFYQNILRMLHKSKTSVMFCNTLIICALYRDNYHDRATATNLTDNQLVTIFQVRTMKDSPMYCTRRIADCGHCEKIIGI